MRAGCPRPESYTGPDLGPSLFGLLDVRNLERRPRTYTSTNSKQVRRLAGRGPLCLTAILATLTLLRHVFFTVLWGLPQQRPLYRGYLTNRVTTSINSSGLKGFFMTTSCGSTRWDMLAGLPVMYTVGSPENLALAALATALPSERPGICMSVMSKSQLVKVAMREIA